MHTVGQLYCSFNVLGKRLSVKRRLVGFMCFKAESYTCTVCFVMGFGFMYWILPDFLWFWGLGFMVLGFNDSDVERSRVSGWATTGQLGSCEFHEVRPETSDRPNPKMKTSS